MNIPSSASHRVIKAGLVIGAGATLIVVVRWLISRKNVDDDALFSLHPASQPRQENSHTSTTGVAASSNRIEAIAMIDDLLSRLGDPPKTVSDLQDDDTDSYETDVELELGIANEMEIILRQQIMELSVKVLDENGALRVGADVPKKKGKKKQCSPIKDLLDLAKQYLEVSEERLKVLNKRGSTSGALVRPSHGGWGQNGQVSRGGGVSDRIAVGYGDMDDDEEDDNDLYWGHNEEDEDMWDDEDDEEDWEDEGEEGEDDDMEVDDEYPPWLQADRMHARQAHEHEENLIRATFEQDLVKCVKQLQQTIPIPLVVDKETSAPEDHSDNDNDWVSDASDANEHKPAKKSRKQPRGGTRRMQPHSRKWVDL